jgi:NitT/TauT family transport system ATP-binding protein
MDNDKTSSNILELHQISKAFAKPSGEPLPVLSDISLSLHEGEIVGLLGRSGSGKSTLLRIIDGLIKPTSGEVRYCGEPLTAPAAGIAVVFQTFALYPWLTVMQNVDLGLDALKAPRAEAERRVMSAIDLIGLDGFQSAYPRELSGGMRQRVGFARALVSDPTLLLMDEPFSALDVLTAETLRTDFLDLWAEHHLPIKAVLMVTHNIEEAVLMCDRILVLASNPGRIAADIQVALPQPRNRLDAAFHSVVDDIYSILTSRTIESIALQNRNQGSVVRHLPQASTNQILGFLETLAAAPYGGHAELAKIAAPLALAINKLFPVAESLHLLEFAQLDHGAITLTAAGHLMAQAGTDERKKLFREQLLRFVPLVTHIRQVLNEREDHAAPRARFEFELEDHLNASDAEKTLRIAIGWGRYAELFAYDDATRGFRLVDAAH